MKFMRPTAKPHACSLEGSKIGKILCYKQRQHNESQGSNRRKSFGMSIKQLPDTHREARQPHFSSP
jgi:hypothetical protein